MTDKVQKIREKVVEIVNSINPFIPDEDGKNSDYEAGRLDEAIQILQVIDSLQEEPVSEDFEKIIEEIAEPTILNAYGTKELARRLRNTIYGTSVSEDLEEAANFYANTHTEWFDTDNNPHVSPAFKAGANWQKEQFEKERLKHCDELTAEQAQIESDFVTKHIKENNRTPTFIDAIEYGMKLKKEPSYITKKVGECTTTTKIIKKG